MPRLRSWATVAVFVAALLISVGTAAKVYFGGLRSRPAAVRESAVSAGPNSSRSQAEAVQPNSLNLMSVVRTALKTEDISTWPRDRQRRLLEQLEQSFDPQSAPLVLPASRPSAAQRELLDKNIAELARVWVLSKAQAYAAQKPEDRAAFLDAVISGYRRQAARFSQAKSDAAVLPAWIDRKWLGESLPRLLQGLTLDEAAQIGRFVNDLQGAGKRQMTNDQ
jgi:hypothetical protein